MLLVAWALTPIFAAKRLGPPSLALTAPENRVAVLTAVELSDAGVVFACVAQLHGETPARIAMRVSARARGGIDIGRSYIIGYTTVRRDPRGRSRDFQLDPEGPRMVELPAVGEALFEDTAAMRRLVRRQEDGKEPGEQQILEAIIEQVARPDSRTRTFVLAELMLRPRLADLADEADLEALRATLVDGNLEPQARSYLLSAVAPAAEAGRAGWLAEGCRQVVIEYEPELDLASFVPSLIETAMQTLQGIGRPQDAALLARYLHSNNPGVGIAALGAMAALDESLAVEAARRALEAGGLHSDVRGALERYLGEY